MKCKICHTEMTGRNDRKFCSLKCKNHYHVNLRRDTNAAVKQIDIILHRNRSILLEVMGKNLTQIKVSRRVLDRMNFNFKYKTHSYVNSQNKTYHCLYDFAWMEFSDDEILIVKNR